MLTAGCAGLFSDDDEGGNDVNTSDLVNGDGSNGGITAVSNVGAAAVTEAGRCLGYSSLKNAYFGDLHIHTAYSVDAYNFGTRTDAVRSYAFARGQPLPLADGSSSATHDRPLDFAAVTDHAENIGKSPAGMFTGTAVEKKKTAWDRQKQAAEDAYDQTSACRFTSLIGYEWTGRVYAPDGLRVGLHRNVIFRGAGVPPLPVSSLDQPTPEGLWSALTTTCLQAGNGCNVLAIPHSSNLSRGMMFDVEGITDAAAAFRARLEPLAEVFQHKGNSEAREGGGTYKPGSFVRNALEAGLRAEQRMGVNPLKLGIIASTDTHSSAAGMTEEYNWSGHLGRGDLDPQDRVRKALSPGGLAAVWAEENTREAIFDALQRREAFGTSGTRLKVRFFGGWSFPANACQRADLVELGYAQGVPMGANLPARPAGAGAPSFVVWAARDPGTAAHPGAKLQHVQVIKGWVDPATGLSQNRVYQVAGNPKNGANVDTTTCAGSGPGEDVLCTVWTDPDFVASQRAFYYVRVFENPSCNYLKYDCDRMASAERPPPCFNPARLKGKELGWSSPIWYLP